MSITSSRTGDDNASILRISVIAFIYVCVSILPICIRISLGWRRSLSIYTTEATEQESAPLLGSSSSETPSCNAASTADNTNRTSDASIASRLGEWEVVNAKEMQDKPGNHWILTLLAQALSLVWIAFTFYVILEGAALDSLDTIVAIVITLFDATITFIGATFVIVDARKTGLKNAVEIERFKNSQRCLAFFVVGYILVFDVTPFIGIAIMLLLTIIAVSIPMGRLQRKPVDGFVPNLEEDANFFSRAMLYWMNPLVEYGYSNKIEFKDLWNASKTELAEHPVALHKNAVQRYKLYHNGASPSLFIALGLVHWPTLAFQLCLVFLNIILFFSNAFFVYNILEMTPPSGKPDPFVYWYVLGMFVFAFMRYIVGSIESQLVIKLGVRIRNLLSALIYEKSLKRAPVAKVIKDENADDKKASASIGKVVNLMSADAGTIGEWIGFIYTPVMVGLQILISVLSLIYILGWSAIPGVIVLIATIFSGSPLATRLRRLYGEMKKAVDKRISIFNEVVSGIKIIKFFAWEMMFAEKIETLRANEMDIRWKVQVNEVFNRLLWYSSPYVTTVTTLGFFTLVAGKDLTASIAFTALTLFNNLREPLQRFPDTLIQLLDSLNSLKRIENYLKEDELEFLSTPPSSTKSLGFSDNACFAWDKPDAFKAEENVEKITWKNLFKGKKNVEEKKPDVEQRKESQFELKDLNLEFPEGKVSVVVGATGSGKTALLLSLLGETHRLKGTLNRPANAPIAYVPQSAWLINASIRENILFGQPLDATRYRRVIKACCLERDLELLEGGDLTEIGEKGINLSGGQKQRISIARACYSTSPIVVLDDPLSAVDAPTAKLLMEGCVIGLLEGRTRILVTNAAGLAIPRCDHLFVVHAGRVIHQGPVEEVVTEIRQEVEDPTASSGASSVSSYTAVSTANVVGGSFKDGLREMLDVVSVERVKFLKELEDGLITVEDPLTGEDKKGVLVHDDVAKKLVEEEKVGEGVMGSEVYRIYMKAAGGWPFFLLLLLGYALNHASTMGLDTLVYLWCKAYEAVEGLAIHIAISSGLVNIDTTLGAFIANTGSTNMLTATASNLISTTETPTSGSIARFFLPIYFIMILVCLAVIAVRFLLLAMGSIRAGRNIHRMMVARLVRAPVKFFEVTPLGRIMNRFTKDMMSVDRAITTSAGNLLFNVVLITFTFGAIAFVVPAMLIAIIPIVFIYWSIGQYFVRTSRSLKRLDSVSRSPIFSHFSETLSGVMVIRAFNDVPRFNKEIYKRIDAYARINMLFSFSYRWLSVRTQIIGSVIAALSTFMILQAGLGRSLTGLCVTFAINVTNILYNFVLMQGWLDSNMNSMERCNEYLKIEQEAPEVIPENRPPQSWPSEGRISIDGLRLKYGPDLPEVLRGMSCEIGAMEKVAVVGRTGAGKSSLALALFRMVEPSGGNIRIDGVDILRIGLEDLRSRLTIIPQDPILFTGTVRTNLDPFGVIPDADLWIALKRSHLISSIPTGSGSNSSSPSLADKKLEPETLKRANGSEETLVTDSSSVASSSSEVSITLDTDVAEGGSNLSAGQRQLLCLARAMARKSRIIVMDEATASVDPETDSRIQQTIREEFSDCTVITIAHRLKTIVDYDRVVVLDAGQVVENASPFELIENGDGVFRKMCEETGEFDDLVVIAKGRHLITQQRG
ncbi:hypothetical protein HDU97_007515 [Phlyctochytrium planicorne]|nr:hypothetical protein HDU97_007515 [Phlyctochytrium planicorne]